MAPEPAAGAGVRREVGQQVLHTVRFCPDRALAVVALGLLESLQGVSGQRRPPVRSWETVTASQRGKESCPGVGLVKRWDSSAILRAISMA